MTTAESQDVLELGAGLPAWLLRVVIAIAAGTVVLILARQGIDGPALVLLVVAALVSVGFPASPGPMLVVILVAVSQAALGSNVFGASVLALVPLVHLLHVSCALAGLVPVSARVHLAALRGPALRWLAVQAGTFTLVGVMALAPSDWRSAPAELLALLGVVAVAGLLARLIRHE